MLTYMIRLLYKVSTSLQANRHAIVLHCLGLCERKKKQEIELDVCFPWKRTSTWNFPLERKLLNPVFQTMLQERKKLIPSVFHWNSTSRDCPFTKEVWTYLNQWLQLSAVDSVVATGSLHGFSHKCRAKFDRSQRKMIDGIIIYFWWNVWKKQIDEFSNKNPLQPRQLSSSSMQKWHTTISTRQKTFNRWSTWSR